jgi:hypothetical protein
MQKLKNFAEHPVLNLLVGLILLGIGLYESWSVFSAEMQHFNLGAYHGMMVLGLVQILKAIPELVEGMKIISVDMERK